MLPWKRPFATWIIFAACAPSIPLSASEADVAAVREARAAMNKFLADHDMPGFRVFIDEHTTDELFLGTPAWRSAGRDQVYDVMKDRTVGRRPLLAWDHTPEEITVNEAQNFISERGVYIQRWIGKGVVDQWNGSYYAIWKRFTTGGPWLLDVESFVPLKCTGDGECAPRLAQHAGPVRPPANQSK
jgi:hypothetical protein